MADQLKEKMMKSILLWGLVPPILLMMYMYRLDKVEKEPVGLVFKTFIFGMISVIPAIILELGLGYVLDLVYPGYTQGSLYNLLYYFLVVGFSEEFSKRLMANAAVWKSPEFNYHFDAIIYYATSALGFAALENIMYMTQFGAEIAISRLIPVHVICGIFMGYFMGWAKTAELDGMRDVCGRRKMIGLIIPIIIHGTWDFCVSSESETAVLFVLGMIIVLTLIAFRMIHREAKKDTLL